MVSEQIAKYGSDSLDGEPITATAAGKDENRWLELGVNVVSIRGAKGKKLIEAPQWKSREYRRARAERSAIESLVFNLKENFDFAEMMRRSRENVEAEMMEKVLADNIVHIIRVRKRLKESEEVKQRAANSSLGSPR